MYSKIGEIQIEIDFLKRLGVMSNLQKLKLIPPTYSKLSIVKQFKSLVLQKKLLFYI